MLEHSHCTFADDQLGNIVPSHPELNPPHRKTRLTPSLHAALSHAVPDHFRREYAAHPSLSFHVSYKTHCLLHRLTYLQAEGNSLSFHHIGSNATSASNPHDARVQGSESMPPTTHIHVARNQRGIHEIVLLPKDIRLYRSMTCIHPFEDGEQLDGNGKPCTDCKVCKRLKEHQ